MVGIRRGRGDPFVLEGLGVDHGESAFGGSSKQELLHRQGRAVGQDDLVGVNVFGGVGGDLIVHLAQLFDDLLDPSDDVRLEVPLNGGDGPGQISRRQVCACMGGVPVRRRCRR